MDLQTILGFIFGAGALGLITVLVTSYRRLKTGKISDEESVIKRLYRELQRQEKRADDADEERDKAVGLTYQWRTQAYEYRLQLIEAGVTPKDDPRLWNEGTSNE
jgi:hypothetical protein